MKKYFSIGEIFQSKKLTNKKNDILSLLKWNWGKIFDPNFIPTKYIARSGILFIYSDQPSIYVASLAIDIKDKCNKFLGHDAVRQVRFTQKINY